MIGLSADPVASAPGTEFIIPIDFNWKTLSIFQQGTFAPDSSYRWMGSIAMDQSGNMALGFSLSSSSVVPRINYTGRLASSPAGQMDQGEATLQAGGGYQTNGLTRWGDYSMMAVDPSDDFTFWYTNEYLPATGSFNWSTRIGSPSTVTLNVGASGTSTISTAITSGVGQSITLTANGLPAGVSASFGPNPFTAGGSSTLTLSTVSSALAGC